MHNILAAVLIAFAGWTLASHLAVMAAQPLRVLIGIAPIVIALAYLSYLRLPRQTVVSNFERRLQRYASPMRPTNPSTLAAVLPICVALAFLFFSWTAFWAAAILILIYQLTRERALDAWEGLELVTPRPMEWLVVVGLIAIAAWLTLAVMRSDLDDAFYVAVAAFAAGHPNEPLLAFDPMHVERDLPLLFPSYKFASFELLAGALAYIFSVPAMDVMYKVFPPFWAGMTIVVTCLFAQTMNRRRWLLITVITVLLMVVLGETHRGPANFAFVRLHQGKAVYLSTIGPAIFYLTARYLSPRGTTRDLFLLGCAQIGAIGLTNFGMLAAPLLGFGAMLSNIWLLVKGPRTKLLRAIMTLTIPMPYLVFVAASSDSSSVLYNLPHEHPADVWSTVYGGTQQYLVGALLLLGPTLAKEKTLRFGLAVPPLLLLLVYLNPWLFDLISRVTTPPVYWRVVWSFPILVFLATSICIVIDRVLESPRQLVPWLSFAVIVTLIMISLPLHTLRSANKVTFGEFAARKISPSDYIVAEKAINRTQVGERLLAPEAISGIVAMFESHPQLVYVRSGYIHILSASLGQQAYLGRLALHSFVTGSQDQDEGRIRAALKSLQVGTIVIQKGIEENRTIEILQSENFQPVEYVGNYSIWSLHNPVRATKG